MNSMRNVLGYPRIVALLAVAVALAVSAGPARAQTIQYIEDHGNSITFGDKVFSNFSVSVNTSAGQAVVPNAAGITVNYLGLSGTTETLGFDFNAFAGAFTPGSFSDGDFTIRFHVHSLGAPITSIGLTGVSATVSGIGSATIDESSLPVGTPTDIHYTNANGVVTSNGGSIAYVPPQTDLNITKDVNFSAFDAGTTSITTMSAFDETFTQQSFVPEPASLIMAGLGCAGFAGYGLRKRRKS
jgi:hypothetical protein